jgi:hypothetical protein
MQKAKERASSSASTADFEERAIVTSAEVMHVCECRRTYNPAKTELLQTAESVSPGQVPCQVTESRKDGTMNLCTNSDSSTKQIAKSEWRSSEGGMYG